LPLPKQYGKDPEPELVEQVRKDVISHYVLRLAYRKPNDRTWFITQERRLLDIRLQLDRRFNNAALRAFLDDNQLQYPRIDEAEFRTLRSELYRCWASYDTNPIVSESALSASQFYCVPFEEALDLVQQRKVYLRGGVAYVAEEELISIVLAQYRAQLSEALARAFKALPLHADERVDSIVDLIPRQYIGNDYGNITSNRKAIQLHEIDALAKRSYPLCMRHLHSRLRQTHHLRHLARMQYGLFLKGIGVSLEDSLEFWRRELVQKYGEDGWRKKGYAYNIKHNYGQEGKRANYTPYACQKIIGMEVMPTDDHGCPFRHNDMSSLQAKLFDCGIRDPENLRSVMTLVQDRHYQEACKRVFDLTHPNAPDYIQNHPNKFFDESMKYYESKAPAGANSSTTNSASAPVPATQPAAAPAPAPAQPTDPVPVPATQP
jgi:DNA primase large subunit